MITDPYFFAFALPAVLALGLAKGGFAGLGMIAVPLVSLYAPPLQAAAIFLPILIAQDFISVWVFRHEWDSWNLKVMIPGAFVGIAIAGVLAAYLTESHVRLAVGIISVAFVLNVWFGRIPLSVKPTALRGAFWGAVSGFTSTLCQAGSPPYQMHIAPQRLPKMIFVGTTAIFFMFINMMKIVPYVALGQFSRETLMVSLVLLPAAYLTNLVGIWLVRRIPTETFYHVIYVLVFLVGLTLIAQALVEVWR